LTGRDMSGAALMTTYGKWMSKSSYVAGNRLGKRVVWIFRSERGHHLLVKACQSLDGANLLNHGGEGA
jgi:hypothetical protein